MERFHLLKGYKLSTNNTNVNEKIKELHKQGKSVLEISKQLNIGQGEVKLVLALYGGDNK